VVAAAVCAAAVAPLGVARPAGVYAALWLLAGAGSALLWAGLNTVALEAVPANRAGAVSVFAAAKFAGTAVAPLVWLPLYHGSSGEAFLAAAAVTATIVPIALVLRRLPPARQPAPPPAPQPG